MTETALSTSIIYRARPTLRLAGAEDPRASELLIGMRMEETEGGMSAAELRFSNWASLTNGGAEYAFGAGAKLKLGAEIAVYAGDEAQPREIFHGTDHGAGGRIRHWFAARDDRAGRGCAATRADGPPQQDPRDKSPADVARAIAGDLGLTPVIAGLDTPVGTWAQLNESDLAFLRRLLGALRRRSADRRHGAARLAARRRAARRARAGAVQPARARRASRVDLADQVTAITTPGLERDRRQGGVRQGQRPHPRRTGPGTRRCCAGVADARPAQRASRPSRGGNRCRGASRRRGGVRSAGAALRHARGRRPRAMRSCGSARIAR